jgi:hypothetical protein
MVRCGNHLHLIVSYGNPLRIMVSYGKLLHQMVRFGKSHVSRDWTFGVVLVLVLLILLFYVNPFFVLNKGRGIYHVHIFRRSGWLVIYCFTSHSRMFHLHGDVTITGERLQNLGLCSAIRAFEQGKIFIVPHLLWIGASVFPVTAKGPPHSVASYDTQGNMENPYGSPFSRLLRHTKGCGGPTVTQILTGFRPSDYYY